MLEIIVAPAHNGKFTALLDGRKLCTATEPLFAACRKLLAEGVDPETIVTMRHQGSATRSFTFKVGLGARLRAREDENQGAPRIVPWDARPFRQGEPPVR